MGADRSELSTEGALLRISPLAGAEVLEQDAQSPF